MKSTTTQPSLLRRSLDSFIGPNATPAEIALQFLPPVLFAIFITLSTASTGVQKPLSVFLGFDLLGGVITNSTTAAKKWYHRPGTTKRDHLLFVAPHLLHLILIALLFRDFDFGFLITTSFYLVTSAVIIVYVDIYLRKPVAMTLYCGALLLDNYFWYPTPHIQWFVPLFFLKLLVSHLLPL